MKKIGIFCITAMIFLYGCKDDTVSPDMNKIAEKYVRLGLNIGQYDGDFVDAYYGPDSLKPVGKKLESFPKDSFLRAVAGLKNEVSEFLASKDDTLKQRASWITGQLTAFDRRIRNFAGEYSSFDDETQTLFGVTAPTYPEKHFQDIINSLDSLLPGEGDIASRMQQLSAKFIIPKDRIDTVFKTSYREARKRTLAHYTLPPQESFEFEFVTGKPWSGYNWYKGNYHSLIQQNLDLPINIDRAIDLACHEGYPGHHVYNALLEKNLYHDKGWVEISLYPLFSPQSLIAEGSANYGVDLAFPEDERDQFVKEILLPLAGMDTNGAALHLKMIDIKKQLNYSRNEVARGLINNTMDSTTALNWLMKYNLASRESALKSISFIKKYRSYVINYNYGLDMVRKYIHLRASTHEEKWVEFGKLLSYPVTAEQLK